MQSRPKSNMHNKKNQFNTTFKNPTNQPINDIHNKKHPNNNNKPKYTSGVQSKNYHKRVPGVLPLNYSPRLPAMTTGYGFGITFLSGTFTPPLPFQGLIIVNHLGIYPRFLSRYTYSVSKCQRSLLICGNEWT